MQDSANKEKVWSTGNSFRHLYLLVVSSCQSVLNKDPYYCTYNNIYPVSCTTDRTLIKKNHSTANTCSYIDYYYLWGTYENKHLFVIKFAQSHILLTSIQYSSLLQVFPKLRNNLKALSYTTSTDNAVSYRMLYKVDVHSANYFQTTAHSIKLWEISFVQKLVIQNEQLLLQNGTVDAEIFIYRVSADDTCFQFQPMP